MRVESVPTTVYIFTEDERDYLIELGVWNLLKDRLKDHERIEVE